MSLLPSTAIVEIEPAAPARETLTVCAPEDPPPPPPEPPYQPWLRGAASMALLRRSDPAPIQRRRRAPFLFRHRRRHTLMQMLALRGAVFSFAYGPAPLMAAPVQQARARLPVVKLPVIGRAGEMDPASCEALERLSDPEPLREEERPPRPSMRAHCVDGPRPCPWVSCRYHLLLDVNPDSGSIRLNHPDVEELDDLDDSCALDVADRVHASAQQELALSGVARKLGISHERVRQIQTEAEEKFALRQAQERRWAPLRQALRKTKPT